MSHASLEANIQYCTHFHVMVHLINHENTGMHSVAHAWGKRITTTLCYSMYAKELMSAEFCSVLSSLEVEHLCLELLWVGLVSSFLHCWQDSAPSSLFPPCAWSPWQPPLKNLYACLFILMVGACINYSNHRVLHTNKCGYFFPVCSDFMDNELADVFQFGVRVNVDWGVGIWGGWDQRRQNIIYVQWITTSPHLYCHTDKRTPPKTIPLTFFGKECLP